MNKKESNKVNSFNASVEVMLKNEPIWTGSANATRQFGLIQAKKPLVSVYDQKQITGEKPSSEVKKNIKMNVIPMAVKLSKSAIAYFAGEKNVALEFSAKLVKSKLEKLKENTLLTALFKFYNIILPFKDHFEHLNPTDVADFAVMLEDLKKALPQPQVETDESKTANWIIRNILTPPSSFQNPHFIPWI